MSKKHRVRVVAAGLLLVMAALTLLPVTSGAFMIKFRDPDQYPTVGDPDDPSGTGIVIRVPFMNYSLRLMKVGGFLPVLFTLSDDARLSRGQPLRCRR
jgi:hypothetical protein